MRSAGRTLLAAAPAGAVLGWAWLRLEQPAASLWRAAAVVLLGFAAASLSRPRLRTTAAAVAVLLAVWLAFGVSLAPPRPLDPGSGFGLGGPLNAVASRFGNGFLDFYGTHLPFDPRVHVAMAQVVLAALFCFSLLLALLVAAKKPLAAALVLLLGAGWPATLLGPTGGTAVGAAILAAGLLLLAAAGSRRVPGLAVPVGGVVVLAAVVVGSAMAGGHALVGWQSWDPAGAAASSANVSFVWTPQYGGLNWPRQRTDVLQVRAAHEPSFLRATVLDDFAGDAWAIGPPRPADSLEPAAAWRPENQTRQSVTVEGLVDTHLVGGSVPVRYAAGNAPLSEPERGFALLPAGLARGFQYTVWSYAPRPSAAELERARPDYPGQLVRGGMLDVANGVKMPVFGTPHRAAALSELLTRNSDLDRYAPLARLAERVAGRERTPYQAVAALEQWFIAGGGFRYSDHPRVVEPALVGFVTQTRTGYCQFFAGAMALMLRYLGIPARVAVGFAGGSYDASRRVWLVSDHDAHAWVEVWFRGYGWLPFDPTPPVPGSDRVATSLARTRTRAADNPLPSPGILARVAAKVKLHGKGARTSHLSTLHRHRRERAADGIPLAQSGTATVLVLLLVFAAVLGGIGLTKFGLRLVRRLEHDPRRIAAACREELEGFLLDQGIEPARGATLAELGELVRRELGVDARAFVAAATAARFGPLERADDAAGAARRELYAVREACRRGLTRRERLRGVLSLRSLARPAVEPLRSASLGTVGS